MEAETLARVLARCETDDELAVWDAAFSSAIALPRAQRDALREARVNTHYRLLLTGAFGVASGAAGERDPADRCRAFLPGPPSGGCFGDTHPLCSHCKHFERP